MPLNEDFILRISRMLQHGESFFVYRLPHGEVRMADPAEVRFTPWENCGANPMPVWRESTLHHQYIADLCALIEKLRLRGGKTVISRAICGSYNGDITRVAFDFFDAYPDAYCTFFYTPATGAWLGASPEILYRSEGKILYTMALAGTRRLSMMPWDIKNIEEHRLVADFVESILGAQGASYRRHPLSTLRYGAIEHLLTEFEVDAATVDRFQLAADLHPTPAVGGFPREDALADIKAIERHPRGLYSGLIELSDSNISLGIVNLRCMHFDAGRYCIYAGGGITADSDPYTEWLETEAKSAWLREHINHIK